MVDYIYFNQNEREIIDILTILSILGVKVKKD